MKDGELQFDRSCHVLYSKPCKKEIQAKSLCIIQRPSERLFGNRCSGSMWIFFQTGARIWAANGTSTTAQAAPMTASPS